MKFSQLKIGDRFHYRNADFTKTGPLQAVADGSSSAQLIMRSAEVRTLDEQAEPNSTGLSVREQLHQAIDGYHRACQALVLETPADTAEALARLEVHYRELLQTMERIDSD
ncbi:MAG: hypothetical protein KDI49_11085 [Gammaproteobacteria bacterium]|nr:hypothetical protein [Gammaproteobacteria bacterium]MCB1879793.1 hypothetical protein [Gammaproteobacteria bacterium]